MPAVRGVDNQADSVVSARAMASPAAAAASAQVSAAYESALPQLQSYIENDQFTQAWQLAEHTGAASSDKAVTTNPLLEMLESSQGLNQLDPGKNWTQAEDTKFYSALMDYTTGVYDANLLGKNAYGNWGDASKSASDAATDFATDKGAAPDVSRFAGAKPTQSFLSKYGSDIALIATAVLAPELAPILADAGGAAALVGGEAALGAAGTAAGDVISGKAVTGKGLLGGAVGGALGAGTVGSAVSSDLGGGILGGAGAGALGGAVKGAISGTGALKGAELGAIGGGIGSAISGSGASGLGQVGLKVAGSELTGLASSALPSGSKGGGASSSENSSVADPNSIAGMNGPQTFTDGLTSGLASSLGTGSGSSILGSLGSFAGSAAPYAAVAGIGLAQAKAGEAQDAKASQAQQALAQPSITESNDLLGKYNAGVINPTDQATSSAEIAQGQQVVQSAQGLSNIAQTAFSNYNSGTLNAADQTALDQQTAAQKQQVAQQLSSAGITDSTILAAQYQQIDNNALISKQNTLNGYFNTGNQAYNSWLTATTEGQQTIQRGMEFASTSLQTELSNSMAEANIGIGEMNTAIQTQMTTDANYAAQVSTLMGTLATAYAKQVAGQKSGGGVNAGNVAGNAAGNAAAGIGAAATRGITQGSTGNTAGVSDEAENEFNSDADLGFDTMQNTAGATLGDNSIGGINQSFFDDDSNFNSIDGDLFGG